MKHQEDVLSLIHSSTGTAAILESNIGQLRADNIALMTSATIQVQQAGGSCFLFECLYEIACAEEKEVH